MRDNSFKNYTSNQLDGVRRQAPRCETHNTKRRMDHKNATSRAKQKATTKDTKNTKNTKKTERPAAGVAGRPRRETAPQSQTSQVRGLCCDAVFVSPPAKRAGCCSSESFAGSAFYPRLCDLRVYFMF